MRHWRENPPNQTSSRGTAFLRPIGVDPSPGWVVLQLRNHTSLYADQGHLSTSTQRTPAHPAEQTCARRAALHTQPLDRLLQKGVRSHRSGQYPTAGPQKGGVSGQRNGKGSDL